MPVMPEAYTVFLFVLILRSARVIFVEYLISSILYSFLDTAYAGELFRKVNSGCRRILFNISL